MEWVEYRAVGVGDISASGWLAIAAWLAVVVLIAALLYGWRQYQRARLQTEEVMQPNVAMFMEPAANDWHLVELVVKNFGRTPAFGIRFEFANAPTVGKYETGYEDQYLDIVPLNLPAEIPYLAPSQEWRIVWDSALDRRELGEAIASRFDGAVTYYDQPTRGATRNRRQFRSTAVLDWATLHPVERLQLLTTHDLARQEKQKLELLRNLLTYYHYAASESREEVLRVEINRVRNAADDLRDRYRAQFNAAHDNAPHDIAPRDVAPRGNPSRNNRGNAPRNNRDKAPHDNAPHHNGSHDNGSHDNGTYDNHAEFEDAHTLMINGRHRRGLA